MAGLTTHVLDLMNGRPAAGCAVTLFERGENGALREITKTKTGGDGRCPGPLLGPADLKAGIFQLDFHIGDYYRSLGVSLAEPAFLNVVPIIFGIAYPTSHYHVPLLVSPYGYTTYRGS